MARNARKPSLLLVGGLTLASIAYLVLELGYNAHLTDIVGRGAPAEDIESAELWGRLVAGVGAGLLVFRFAISRLKDFLPGLLIGGVAATLAGAGVYHGQRMLIDQAVAHAPAEAKKTAVTMALLRSSLAAGSLEWEGLPSDPDDPEAKVLVALSGLVAWAEPALASEFRTNIDSHVEALLAEQVDMGTAWTRYNEWRSRTERGYRDYAEASEALLAVQRAPEQTSGQIYDEILSVARQQWSRVPQAENQALNLINDYHGVHRQLSYYFRDKAQFQGTYDEMMQEAFGRAIAPETWCTNTCPGDPSFVRSTLARLSRERFEEATGVGFGERPEQTFEDSAAFAEAVRTGAAEAGLNIAANWQANGATPREAFSASVRDQIIQTAEERFAEGTIALGADVRPGLSREAFVALPGVSRSLREGLGLSSGQLVSTSWSRSEFEEVFRSASLRTQAIQLAEESRAPVAEFEPGGALYERGGDALRSVIVPPVAMAFSLGFGLSNLLALFFTGIRGAAGFVYQTDELPRVFHLTHQAGPLLGLALLIVAPLVLPIGLTTTQAGRDLFDAAGKSSVPLGLGLRWLGALQPTVYPVAEGVRTGFLADTDFTCPPFDAC